MKKKEWSYIVDNMGQQRIIFPVVVLKTIIYSGTENSGYLNT